MAINTVISSRSNPLVKKIRMLSNRKERQESGLFLAEGIHLVGEAVDAGWDIETIVFSPDLLRSAYGLNLVEQQQAAGRRCQPVSGDIFSLIAGKDNPQGILAIIRQRCLTLEDLHENDVGLSAAVVSPQDPANVGVLLRSLDSFGAGRLFLLDGGVDPYHPTCVRSSMGGIFWIPIVQASFDAFSSWVRGRKSRLVGTSAHAEMDYREIQGVGRTNILLLGNEQKGLTEEQLHACDLVVSIPMRGHANSLNLAVAASILVFIMVEGNANQ